MDTNTITECIVDLIIEYNNLIRKHKDRLIVESCWRTMATVPNATVTTTELIINT